MRSGKPTREANVLQKVNTYRQYSHIFEGLLNTVVGRSTVQLFGVKKGHIMDPIASGVLFKTAEELFILTAAHAADELRNEATFVQFNGRFVQIFGLIHCSKLPASGKRDDDVYDFAVIHIEDKATTDLLKSLAATPRDIYVPPVGYIHLRGNVIFGFPIRDFKRDGRLHETSSFAGGAYGVLPVTYERLGINANDQIILKHFKTTYTARGISRSRSMRGVSGGGVWLVPDLIGEPFTRESPFTTPRLMAIFTEVRRKNSVFLATKVNFHLDKIMETYPGILLNRPPTPSTP